MLVAVDYKNGGVLGVYDSEDRTTEYISLKQVKQLIKSGVEIYGVKLKEKTNPIYTLDGLQINLLYQHSTRIDRFRIALLPAGSLWGMTFSRVIDKPTVAFFDTSVDFPLSEYPSGQYISSYYAETLLQCNGGLMLDADVPEWKLDARDMWELKEWLGYQLKRG